MVWFVNKFFRNSKVCRSGALSHWKHRIQDVLVYQTSNIMFNFANIMYDVDDIYSLICSGVNIFNIDRNLHDNSFTQKIKAIIVECDNLPNIFSLDYYRPTSIAITMSIKEIVDIDNKVDIIILKDIETVSELLDFKKQNPNFVKKLIMVWLTKWSDVESIYIVKFSDGVVLDLDDGTRQFEEFCSGPIKLCKENRKPVFYVQNKILNEYYQLPDRDRLLIIMGDQIVKNRLDGIVLVDSEVDVDEFPPTQMIRSLIRAINFAEKDINLSIDCLTNSFEAKIPMLPPISTAFGASLAALKCEAKMIIVLSKTGASSRLISFASPPCHVLCITTRKFTARRLNLYRKVIPLFYDTSRSTNWHQECRNRIHFGTTFALKIGLLELGAKLVVVAPSKGGYGYCNSIQILSFPLPCGE